MSTEFDDDAAQVMTAADNGAYVLGRRNVVVADDASSLTAQTYLGRYNAKGELLWLVAVSNNDALPNYGVSEGYKPGMGALTSQAVYVLFQASFNQPIYLYKFDLNGTLLWSKTLFEKPFGVSALFAAPDGQLYLTRYAPGNDQNFLTALGAEGNVLWEKEGAGFPVATGAEGVYVYRERTLENYSPTGALL